MEGTPVVSGLIHSNKELVRRARWRIRLTDSQRSASPSNPAPWSGSAMSMPMQPLRMEASLNLNPVGPSRVLHQAIP